MQLWAAVDLLGGSAVTLVQGRRSERATWQDSPRNLARRWQDEGADGIHVVDLDAAFGERGNPDVVLSIIEEVSVPVQVGGGVRTPEIAIRLLDSGAARVVVGTMAYARPHELAALVESYGAEKLVVAADYRDGAIVTRGWTEKHSINVLDAVRMLSERNIVNVLATSVENDGMRAGPDITTIRTICEEHPSIRVLASGGIRNTGDVKALGEAGAAGAVIGRALYEETIKLADARRVVD